MYDKDILNDIKNVDIIEYLNDNGYRTFSVGTHTMGVDTCPLCSGDGGHFRIDTRENKYTSFGANCNYTQKRGSIIDLAMQMFNIDWLGAIEELKEYGNITSTNEPNKSFFRSFENKTPKKETSNQNTIYNKPAININFNNIVKSSLNQNNVEYFAKRGLSDKTIKKYKLLHNSKGLNDFLNCDFENMHSKLGFVYQYFIPITNKHGDIVSFVIRANDIVLQNTLNRYRKINPKFKLEKTHNLKGLPMLLFNYAYLEDTSLLTNKDSNKIYLCEGIFDALSLEDIGENAISFNSANNYNKIIPYIKDNLKHLQDFVFIGCGDNDAAGKIFNNKLEDIMHEYGLSYLRMPIPPKYHDVNDMFVNEKNNNNERIIMKEITDKLDAEIEVLKHSDTKTFEEQAKEKSNTERDRLINSSEYVVEDNSIAIDAAFLVNTITNDIVAQAIKFDDDDFNPIHQLKMEALPLSQRFKHSRANSRNKNNYLFDTGFKGLNELLKYTSRKIVGIGAIPGAGKTSLCINLATNLAKQKKYSIFYSLELDVTYVESKILSSLSITEPISTGFLNAEDVYYFLQDSLPTLTIEQEDNLFNLIQYYEKTIKPYLFIDDFINRKDGRIASRSIEAIYVHTDSFIKKYRTIPTIFIDYMQQVETENKTLINDKQRIDYIASKIIAMKKLLGTTIFLISSLNRESYLEVISETSFKESGAIEYAADLLLGIQWRDMAKMIQDAESKTKLKETIEELKKKSTLFRKLEVIVVKHRTGTPGTRVPMDFYGGYNLFTDANNKPNNSIKQEDAVQESFNNSEDIFSTVENVDFTTFAPQW